MLSGSKTQTHAKVVGIACDVCDPDDVHNMASFAVKELGSIDIWVSNLLVFLLMFIYCIYPIPYLASALRNCLV